MKRKRSHYFLLKNTMYTYSILWLVQPFTDNLQFTPIIIFWIESFLTVRGVRFLLKSNLSFFPPLLGNCPILVWHKLSPLQYICPVVSWLTDVWPVQCGIFVELEFWHHLSETCEILPELISVHTDPCLLLKAIGLWRPNKNGKSQFDTGPIKSDKVHFK